MDEMLIHDDFGDRRISPSEAYILRESKIVMPDTFLAESTDGRIIAYANLILADWNNTPPETYYDINGMPVNWLHLIPFGEQVFSTLFMQCRWTLLDFDYTDQGLNIRLDRVPKLDMSYKNLLEMYKGMKENAKHNILIHNTSYGLGTPRFQASIGQFLKLSLGCALPHVNILTKHGLKMIKNICIGDSVLARDGRFHSVYDTSVRNVDEDIFEIHAGKQCMQLTGNHEVLINGTKWVPAEKIRTSDKVLVGADLDLKKIQKIKTTHYAGPVHDLSVKNIHSYNMSGIIVSNSAFSWNSPG